MPNPVIEETIVPRHLDLFCRVDDGVNSTAIRLDRGSTTKKSATEMSYVSKPNGFNKKTTDERKSSSSSDSFIGDARRLSEAGVRRSSGNSVVLTEDTDKFIIGNRIWVGGTKPGHIAYIGETNFGNGDWAGIVLDEPIGKNDGSVSGTRYFQCEPKKGIFARLTNLTSAPLTPVDEDTMIQSSFATTKPLGFSTPMPKHQATTVKTTKTTARSINQQPTSKSTSDLKIGDRVIISSGQGSKLGVLRYRGATQFAQGEWCGIELDDPLGKNNGTVEGIKYFECEDKFGLFAPVAKVSKSPMSASRMSTNCAIHKTKRSPDSMNGSIYSGITSNTMSSIPTRPTKVSDLDRLKLQLTQMKNENELLRLQVTKAANQADVAEKRLEETLKAHTDRPSESQFTDTIMLQIDNMKKQIEEEKEKVQNLQFTNEEQNVVNIELQNKNTELLIKIKELEFNLDKERNIAKDVEKETMKMFEKEEELCRVKEELESLKKLIDNDANELQKSVSNLSSEVVDKETILNTLRQTLNENSQLHDRLLKEANEKLFVTTERLNKIIEEKNKKIEQNQEMIDQLNEGIKCLSALKNEEHDDIVNNLKNQLSKLKDEYKVIFDKQEHDIKVSKENHIQIENKTKQELNNLLEIKNHEIDQLKKKYADLMCLNSSEKDDIKKLKLQLCATTTDLNELKAKNLVYSKSDLEVILQQQIQLISMNFEDLKKHFDKIVSLKDKQIINCNTNLMQIKEQLSKSKSYLEITYNDKIKEKDNEIKILSEKLNVIIKDFENLEKTNNNLNIELKTASNSVQDKSILITNLQKKFDDLESKQDLNRNELEKELSVKLTFVNDELASLISEKTALEEKYENYVKITENTEKSMESKLQENNTCIANLNKSLQELTFSKQNELDSLNKQMLQFKEEQNEILKHQSVELATKDELINSLSNKLEQTLTEKQKQDLKNANLQNELINETTKYQITLKDLQIKINELEVEILSNRELFKKELELSSSENETIKDENLKLLENLRSLENVKLNLEEKLVSNEMRNQDLQSLNEIIEDKNKIIHNNQIRIKQLDDLIVQTKHECEVILKKKEEEIEEFSKTKEEKVNIEMFSLEEKTKILLNEKDNENSKLQNRIKDLENIKISFEQQLKKSESRENDLKQLNETIPEMTKTIEDNNLKISELNNLVLHTKSELESKLQEKEDIIKKLSKIGDEKLNIEKQQMALLDEKEKENSGLIEKINILENTKMSLEQKLELSKTQDIMIMELQNSIADNTKIIDNQNSKIEQLNSMIILRSEEFNLMLKKEEEKMNELMKTKDDKFINEKLLLEKKNKLILDEKDKDISNLKEKINILENIKIQFEQQSEISKKQESEIVALKKSIEEKSQGIEENNLSIELLNNLITQTKKDFDVKLKEKENEIENLVKTQEQKLTAENMTYISNINEKESEIEILKQRLKEYSENNIEKELRIKIESFVNDLEKEKIRVSNLEFLKNELEKTVLQNKTDLQLLETSKLNMKNDLTKTIEDQTCLINKINIECEQLNNDKSQIQKGIDELTTKLNELQFTLHEKNCEIENLKTQVSQKLNTVVSNSDELNQLKTLREKDLSSQSHLEFRIQELTDENHRLNEHIEMNNTLLQKKENIIKENDNIKQKYEETYSLLKIKENQVLVLQTELNSWKLKDMGKSKNNSTLDKTEKSEALLLAEKNEEIKMLNSIILSLHKKLSAVMETDVSEFEVEKNPNSVSKEDYQKLYKTAKNNVKLKECENLSLRQEICKLKTENESFSEFKTKCELLEKDKKALQTLIINYESSHSTNDKNEKSDIKSETAKILEEKDWQINLLNKIIADLHTKVSNNKFKIEALEKQILDSGVDQNKKIRLRTTRLYCERCEIFDSHDTEDCPEKPESPKFRSTPRVLNDYVNRNVEEPFCTCCEMYGHTAIDCNNLLTF
ncbi:Hypothetical protein CINCED_3A019655 [Cinara cedri]|uniref:CAP-Gly domain-containing protein n=1 Tax=Cinara cedri TaxID=506608 RepID=A0A5E4NH25_9HEMI|nr:Hypothetical protein CINCED_3A019655 [Cinara cedri]